jgi:tetratricopeptide (TPR) repeat protein
MVVTRLRSGLIGALLAASGAVLPPTMARAQTAAGDSLSLLDTAAVKARVIAERLERQAGTPRARAPRSEFGLTQYNAGIAQLASQQYDSALVPLRAAVTVNDNSARFHGDLAYTYARLHQWDEAGTQYAAAIRLQSTNPWYYIGLGAVRAAEHRWTEASANLELAYAVDSTALNSAVVDLAMTAAEKGNNESQLFEWAQRGTARFPNDAMPWLRLASMLRSRGDTAHGLEAIRHFRALAPQNPMGAAVYALYLADGGHYDSAVVLARQAAPDSALRQYVSVILLRAGAHWLNAKEYDSAAAVLAEGRPLTDAGLNHTRYDYYLGVAELMRFPTVYAAAVQNKECGKASSLDSLLTSVDHDVRQGAQIDSVQASQILTSYLPALRQRLDDFKKNCSP